MKRLAAAALLLLLAPAGARADATVVFNEVMYHPATNESALEWVELYNQNAVDVDLSGWYFSDGIDFTFPNGTVIPGRGYLVVAVSPAALTAQTGLTNVAGPFLDRLSNNGEDLDLRDVSGRHMDSLNYGVDGDWPVGPDGTGVSLAKRHPDLGSDRAENWTVSAELGGTPGRPNFTSTVLTGASTKAVEFTGVWRYNDTGADLGTAWRETAYADGAWPVGAGLFYDEVSPLPAPKTTPLAPGRNTYYFRTTFNFDGDPNLALPSFRAILDDGAVFYLNGAEIGRLNMPAGPVTYATMAVAAVGNGMISEPVSVSSANLRVGPNVLAVELHQTSSVVNSGLNVISASGFTVSWDGGDGDYSSPANPASAPANDALASRGVEAIVSTNPTLGLNGAVNDGFYGDGSSWSPAAGDPNPFIVLRFNQAIPVSSIAWSRDNGNAADANCGGTCTDGALGNFTVQYTLVADPASVLNSSSNPSNGWRTVTTVQQLSAQPGFTPHLRHRYDFAATSGDPILATGIRLRIPAGSTIDEVEINPPALSTVDAAFGMEFVITDILPPPPALVFNEISGAGTTAFWLEIINAGTQPANLAGTRIVRSGAGSPRFNLPAQILPPGGIAAFTQAQLGFGAAAGDILSLFAGNGFAFLDAVTVRTNTRARYPDGRGELSRPSVPTPGQPNAVVLRDEIVINEIMYHHPPLDPAPAVTTHVVAVPLPGGWRYQDTGADLGTAWRQPGYNDGAWLVGNGLLAFNTATLPAPVNTTLAGGAVTYYFRTTFNFNGGTSNLSLSLRTVLDDGAVFYLNGTEFHRQNMPEGPVTHLTSANVAVGDAGYVESLNLPAAALVQGVNTLAVEVHQLTSGNASSGIVLSGGGLSLVEEGPFAGPVPPNLALLPGVTPFVIDSLAGFPIHDFTHLNDGLYGNSFSWIGNSGSPGYAGLRFGGSFTIGSIAFGRDNNGTFSDRSLGLYTLQYTQVASPGPATPVTGNPATGWATIGTLNYQGPGSGLFTSPSRRHRFTFTPVDATGLRLLVPGTGLGAGTCIDELEVNPPDTTGDIAFGAELALTTTLIPARPFTESGEEWIELHNRSGVPVDLTGWSVAGTVDYTIPSGIVLSPGGYLVLARQAAALRLKWPEVAGRILGDVQGRMSENDTLILRDALGNTADRIRIHEIGFSDGEGSSLELIDPRADNARAEAWQASDESGRSSWQTVSYRKIAGQRYGSSVWNEFRLGLLDSGEVLIDDVSVVRNPDGIRQELIQNGNFETLTGNTHWRMLGCHENSRIIPEPGNAANHVLRVSASAPARTSHNHVESTYAGNTPIVDGQDYEVRFRARWLGGTPLLATSSYFQRLATVTILQLPARLGTPGAFNSRRVPNAGPTFAGLRHAPVLPDPGQTVTVSVSANDPDGVAAATLQYRLNPATTFNSLPMTLQNGVWSATLPGQAAGSIVQFYVLAQDGLGAPATAPLRGPDSRALYQVADSQGTALPAHEIRVIQLNADRDTMHQPTNVMSQARSGATVIYNRSEVFYDANLRLKGSAAGRIRDGDNYPGYDIGFPPDHLFRGVHSTIGIDRSGRAPAVRQQHEIYVLHMFQRAALPVHHADLCYFIAPKTVHTGTAILQLGGYNNRFVREQFGEDGSVFNFDLTYEPSVTVDGTVEGIKLPVPHQSHVSTDFTDLGDDKEQYRAPFSLRTGERRDDYSGIMRLCKIMGAPQSQFDAQIAQALDVDEALRVTALTILCGIGDIYFSSTPSLPHNCRIYTPADGGPARFLPWDMDFVSTQSSGSSIFPTSSINLAKFMNHTGTRRRYMSHVLNLLDTAFNSPYMDPWLAHYGSVVGQNFTSASSYISSRRNSALAQLPASVPFAITTNGGENYEVNTNVTALSGSGWINVWDIEVNGVPHPVTWTTITNWSLLVPLAPGTNVLVVQGLDAAGTRPANLADTITVTNTLPAVLLPVVINEWMADNQGPGGFADPADGLFQDWLELYNPNPAPVNLGGYHLTDNLSNPTKFTLPTNTFIAAHGFLLVWADENASQNPPASAHLHANFRLSANGEVLGLFAPNGLLPLHTVTFGPQQPNVSQGLFPDGNVGSTHFMTDWTPRAPNRLGAPAPPQITGFTTAPGTLSIAITTLPNRTYRVEYKDNLNAPLWTPSGQVRTATGGTLILIEPVTGISQRFFRVRLE